jgi:hypothetical protein
VIRVGETGNYERCERGGELNSNESSYGDWSAATFGCIPEVIGASTSGTNRMIQEG